MNKNYVSKYYYIVNKYLIKNIKLNKIIECMDYFILVLVIWTLLGDFIFIVSSMINHLNDYLNLNINDYMISLVDTNVSNQSSSTTTVNNSTITRIFQNDESLYNTVISLFIYGTGAFRLTLLRNGGTQGSITFVIGTTLLSNAASKVINNTINDPSYVKNHIVNWQAIWKNESTGAVKLEVDNETKNKLLEVIRPEAAGNKFLGDNSDELFNIFIKDFFAKFHSLLKPVQVDYSDSILANQINDLSIILFILSILITGLIIVLLFNLFIYINMDRIIKFFNNKFIKWYLN